RWGVHATPDGKVVWGELTAKPVPDESAVHSCVLVGTVVHGRGGPEPSYPVELGDVPTDLLLAAKSHVDNVVREFELASTGAGAGTTSDEVPARLTALLDVVNRFAEVRTAIKRQALRAARSGDEVTHLVLELTASAADAAEDYLAALDEIDDYCRAARLLTLETPPQHKVFRQWYVGEVARQLRAVSGGGTPPKPQPFQRRLLAALDQVAAAQRASERAARLYSVAAALAKADTPEAV